MIGGLFWKLLARALPEILLQMCSGTIGIHRRSMLALGLVRMNLTVVSSTATAFFMLTV